MNIRKRMVTIVLCIGAVMICMQGFNTDVIAGEGAKIANSWSQYKSMPQSKKFFPIGVWAQNPARAADYKKLGVDYYFALHGGPNAGQIEQLKKQGMGAICDFNDYAKENLMDDPTVWGWMHGDEPDLAHVYPRDFIRTPEGKAVIKEKWPEVYEELDLANKQYEGWGMGAHPERDIQAGYKEIKSLDTKRPVFLQLSKAVAFEGVLGGRGSHSGKVDVYPGYIAGGDIISFDIYPVAYGKPNQLWLPAQGLDQLKEWGAADKPVMAILEAGFGETWATYEQQRPQVWMAINHGASSITWFCHRWAQVDGKKTMTSSQMPLDDPGVGKAIAAINKEVHMLREVINSPAIEGAVEAVGPVLDLGVRKLNGTLFIFAVDRDKVGGNAVFEIEGIGDATVYVISEKREIKCTAGRFEDSFEPSGVHLYKIVKK